MFGARFAKRMAARYRKRGLEATERAIVELVAQGGVQGATVLEIGVWFAYAIGVLILFFRPAPAPIRQTALTDRVAA